jgi:hypothetical protein
LSALEDAMSVLRDQISDANRRADDAVGLADRTLAQLADANARADVEIATLRDMVGGLRDTVSRAETRAVHAEQRATEAEAASRSMSDLYAEVGDLQ